MVTHVFLTANLCEGETLQSAFALQLPAVPPMGKPVPVPLGRHNLRWRRCVHETAGLTLLSTRTGQARAAHFTLFTRRLPLGSEPTEEYSMSVDLPTLGVAVPAVYCEVSSFCASPCCYPPRYYRSCLTSVPLLASCPADCDGQARRRGKAHPRHACTPQLYASAAGGRGVSGRRRGLSCQRLPACADAHRAQRRRGTFSLIWGPRFGRCLSLVLTQLRAVYLLQRTSSKEMLHFNFVPLVPGRVELPPISVMDAMTAVRGARTPNAVTQ